MKNKVVANASFSQKASCLAASYRITFGVTGTSRKQIGQNENQNIGFSYLQWICDSNGMNAFSSAWQPGK